MPPRNYVANVLAEGILDHEMTPAEQPVRLDDAEPVLILYGDSDGFTCVAAADSDDDAFDVIVRAFGDAVTVDDVQESTDQRPLSINYTLGRVEDEAVAWRLLMLDYENTKGAKPMTIESIVFDAAAAAARAAEAIGMVAAEKQALMLAQADEAVTAARGYADHLQAGEDPTKYAAFLPEREPWIREPATRIISMYEGLRVVYREWNAARGMPHEVEPFQGTTAWRLVERFTAPDQLGKPILWADIKGREFSSSDSAVSALLKAELAGNLVVRRTKVDGKVAYLVRERRHTDADGRRSYSAGNLPEESA